ncbi:MAG: DUF2779 domain-containing protein [Elusimicrobiota bacterium]
MTLSKSQYLRGLQCRKNLWLYRHRPEVATPPSPSLQAIFDQGHEVGTLAWKRFPGGKLIEEDHLHPDEAVDSTRKALGHDVLYEAGAVFDKVLIRADILARDKLVEVKSSTEVKDVYLHDVAVQRYVLEGAGFKIKKTSLLHINNKYVRHGDVDPKGLFAESDVTEKVNELLPEVPMRVKEFHSVVASKDEPRIDIGEQCYAPYECPFIDHCWKHVPEYSIYDIARLSWKKKDALREMGVLRVEDVPDDFELNAAQRKQVKVARSNKPYVDYDGIGACLERFEHPLYFLDFETVNPAIPPYDGLRPFEQLPFQASLHVRMKQGGALKHEGFLADARTDPRGPLKEWLKSRIGPKGSVLAYNASFEARCLEELGGLGYIKERLVDVADPFRKGFLVHPGFKGRWSIKAVLPTLVPGMDYSGLEIKDGSEAQLAFMGLMKGTGDGVKVRKALEEYCAQDTLGMVKLVDVLGGMR